MKITKLLSVSILFVFFLIQENCIAQINVGYQNPGKIDTKAFILKNDATIKVEGYAGLFEKLGNDLLFYGWILDSKSRKVVWNLLEEANDEFFSSNVPGRFAFSKEVKLPAGQYEVYYAAGMNYNRFGNKNYSFSISDLGELFDLIFGDINKDSRDRYIDIKTSKFSMTLTGPTEGFTEIPWDQKVNEFSKNALISKSRCGDNENYKKTFKVLEPIKLNILEIGEQSDGQLYDFAWIVDANTYEKVWPNSETRYRKAGGGNKNKTTFQTITLPKGTYTLQYVTDDTHSYDRWNVLPPYDPQFWGITVWPDEGDKNKATIVDEFDPFVLKLFKARNNDYLSQGFTLKKDMPIRVVSEGESSGDFDMADYGWIVNTDNHQTVWEFSQRKSKYAGGAEKNRILSEEVNLPKGNYIAYYATDDSHAYGHWNSAAPLAPELWGMGIIADKGFFELTDSQAPVNSKILAEIVRVRDSERLSKDFTLDKESKVRIYAIGEGVDGDMVDVGWIKDQSTGKIVWDMTYRITERAGGADKNRMFDGTILLPAGSYTVYFETDDSHSYRHWNDTPPHDQDHYGITVYLY